MTGSLIRSEAGTYSELWRDYWRTNWFTIPDWPQRERIKSFLPAEKARQGDKPLVFDYPKGKNPFLGVLSLGLEGEPSAEAGVLEFPDAGHLLTLAPTRTGKGVSQIIPNLLFYAGSCLVVDIKGENHAVTAEHRANMFPGSKVIKFAPFDADTARYNPLDFIRTNPSNGPTSFTFDDTRLVSEMLLPSKSNKEEYWDIEARNLLTSLLLYVVCKYRISDPRRTIKSVIDLLFADPDFETGDTGIQRMCMDLAEFGDEISYRPLMALAHSLLEHDDKVRNNIVSTCRAGMQIWLSDRLISATSVSDFHFADLKKSMCRPIEHNPAPTTIYVIIPPEYLKEYRSVIRLMVGLAAVELTRSPSWSNIEGWNSQPPCPVMFLLDEFPSLGYMEPIANGLAYLAGYGVQIWTYAQNIGQLKQIYGEAWQNFPANAGATTFFGVNDPDTADYIDRLLGETQEYLHHYQAQGYRSVGSSSSGYSAVYGSSSTSTNLESLENRTNHRFTRHKIASSAEIRAIPEELQLVFIRNKPPILANKLPYYKFELLNGLYETWNI